MNVPSLIRRRHPDKVAILMYHSIVDTPPIVWTQVHVDDFRDQMQYLRDTSTVLSIGEMLDHFDADDIPRNSVVVTFDDGFSNFRSLAFPILEKYRLPATIYLTTSFIDGENEFGGLIWPDYVHALLLSADAQTLDLSELGLDPVVLSSPSTRHRAKSLICGQLKTLPTADRRRSIAHIAETLGGSLLPEHHRLFRGMTWSDVKSIDQSPLIDIGTHTITHPILSRTPPDEMSREVLEPQRTLAGQLGHPIDHFAYPNGTPEDYDERVVELVGTSYRSAVTTTQAMASATHSHLELPRLGIGSDMFFSKFQLFVSGLMEGRP